MNDNASICAFFVYGTLKQGHLRSGLWPKKPISVYRATVTADLYDLGPYPAAYNGDGVVLGEIWEFSFSDVQEICTVMDRIEGFEPGGKNNEYTRIAVSACVHDAGGERKSMVVWMYFCADGKRIAIARKMAPTKIFDGISVIEWPDSLSRVPRTFAEE